MTISQILARILLYGAGWFVTATIFLNLANWATGTTNNRFMVLVCGTLFWAIVLGIW
jgi:hypothetical protein